MLTKPSRKTTLKVLIFPLQNLFLCLNLDAVKKVVPRPEILRGREEYLGLCQFEGREVTVIDLHYKVLGGQSRSEGKSYLVVIESKKGLYGLTVGTLPVMREVDAAILRPLPLEYRERDTLRIASHMLQFNIEKDKPETAFLLDQNRLIEML